MTDAGAAAPDAVLPAASARPATTDVAWLCALYELGQRVANGADPQRVRQEILEHIVRGFDAASGSIALIVEGTDAELELAAGTDLPPGLIGSALPKGTGVYSNFLTGDSEGVARVREAFPEATYARLAEVKRAYDPTNLFRLNTNIIPAEPDTKRRFGSL